MEEVIHYLELKNQYYRKFLAMTSKFLAQTNENRWDGIELFVDNRERVLNIIRSFDFKIAILFDQLDLTRCDLECYRERVKSLLTQRDELGQKIVAVDLELISKMEEVRVETIRDLKRALETSHQMSAFTPNAPRRSTKTKDA